MWKNIAHHLLGPVAHARVRATVRHDAELAAPTGTPIAHGSGPDPDRVLVLGSPVVQGIGVTSYDLSFAGHLARKLAALTGRGADVEAHGIDGFDAVKAAAAIRTENLARFDVVLILGGVTEIVTMLPLTKYGRNIRMLLDAIADNAPASLPVLIAGVAPFMQDMNVPRVRRRRGWTSASSRQNAETRAACEESRRRRVRDVRPRAAGIRLGRDASAVYESWANALLPASISALSALTPKAEIEPDEDCAAAGPRRPRCARHRARRDRRPHRRDGARHAGDGCGIPQLHRSRPAMEQGDRGHRRGRRAARRSDLQHHDPASGVYVVEDLDADPAYRGLVLGDGGATTCASMPDTRSRLPEANASARSA